MFFREKSNTGMWSIASQVFPVRVLMTDSFLESLQSSARGSDERRQRSIPTMYLKSEGNSGKHQYDWLRKIIIQEVTKLNLSESLISRLIVIFSPYTPFSFRQVAKLRNAQVYKSRREPRGAIFRTSTRELSKLAIRRRINWIRSGALSFFRGGTPRGTTQRAVDLLASN